MLTPIMFACHMTLRSSVLGCGAAPGEPCRSTVDEHVHVTRRAIAARANRALHNFGRNLATAGALDRAFNLGMSFGVERDATRDFWRDEDPWCPNTEGRSAP